MPDHPVHEFIPGKLTPHGCVRCGKVKSDPVHRQGGDSKYGRLFTEADVRAMLVEAACGAMDGPADKPAHVIAEEVIVGSTATFPADEPLFLLRGQNKAAPFAIAGGGSYYEECARAGHADGDDKRERLIPHLEAVREASDAMCAWQEANPDRVKWPG